MGLGGFLTSYIFQALKTIFTDLLCFAVLYTLSPILFLMTKLMAVIRPENEFIINQSKVISMGEVILESTPQMCLQLYIILTTLTPNKSQWFSITTSTLAITISLLDKYLSFITTNDTIKKKVMTAIKVSMIFLTNALFRILSLVVMVVFFRYLSVAIIIGSIAILFVSSLTLFCCYEIGGDFELSFLTG